MDSANKSLEIRATPTTSSNVPHLLAFSFALLCLLPFALAWDLTRMLFTLVFENDTFSQIPFIPLVSMFLIYGNRKAIFSGVSFGWVAGAALITPGMILLATARLNVGQLNSTNQAALFVFGIVLIWMGAFSLFFGTRAFRAACFPLLFLLFAVPVPEPILSRVISFLQKGSADAAEGFFHLTGIPYLRRGLIFDLPGVSIRVAEECSGIHSTLALLITTALAGHLFLRSNWRRTLLLIAVVPIAILKNGLRIAGLTLLAIYVNPGFLTGNLHHHGGIVFFMIALVPMALLLILLERGEKPKPAARRAAKRSERRLTRASGC
jgi:exosortase